MRSRRKPWTASGDADQEINMTPMIDCVFQLLIFFMVGTHFRSEDGVLAANLPKQGVKPNPSKDIDENIRIRLFSSGAGAAGRTLCQVDGVQVSFDAQRADPRGEALKSHLATLAHRIGTTASVTIDGEFSVPTGDVVCALNAAIATGYKDINFTVPDYIRKRTSRPLAK